LVQASGNEAGGISLSPPSTISVYFLDFVEHARKLVIELDGSQHGEPRNRVRDRIRDEVLCKEGYLVLRFWNGDVLENLDGVADFIVETLKSRPPTRPSLDKLRTGDLPTRGR
jgi:very-short-patch-repair endonuclease